MSEKMIRVKSCYNPTICPYNRENICCYNQLKENRFSVTSVGIHPLCPLEDAPRWRKYPEEKPLLGGDYLCHHTDDFYIVYEYSIDDGFTSYETMDNVDDMINGWMPIPEIGGE